MKRFTAKVEKFDEKEGIIEGFASVFDVEDSFGDVVVSGAFDKTVKDKHPRDIKMLRGHNANNIIGEWTHMEITTRDSKQGLFMRGQIFTELEAGREAIFLIAKGVLDGLSIGAMIVKQIFNNENDTRELLELNLMENSIVTFPANELARIESLKTAQAGANFKRLIEDILRDGGIHKDDVRRIVAEGVQLPDFKRDADVSDYGKLTTSLNALTNNYKKGL